MHSARIIDRENRSRSPDVMQNKLTVCKYMLGQSETLCIYLKRKQFDPHKTIDLSLSGI